MAPSSCWSVGSLARAGEVATAIPLAFTQVPTIPHEVPAAAARPNRSCAGRANLPNPVRSTVGVGPQIGPAECLARIEQIRLRASAAFATFFERNKLHGRSESDGNSSHAH